MMVEAVEGRELRASDKYFSEEELSKLDKASKLFKESQEHEEPRLKERKRVQACSILRQMFSDKDKPFDQLRF